jgi:hypothetical protein
MDLLKRRKLGVNGVQPNKLDQPCAECEKPMVGIMKFNTQPKHPDTMNIVARLMCDPCIKKLGKEIS